MRLAVCVLGNTAVVLNDDMLEDIRLSLLHSSKSLRKLHIQSITKSGCSLK